MRRNGIAAVNVVCVWFLPIHKWQKSFRHFVNNSYKNVTLAKSLQQGHQNHTYFKTAVHNLRKLLIDEGPDRLIRRPALHQFKFVAQYGFIIRRS